MLREEEEEREATEMAPATPFHPADGSSAFGTPTAAGAGGSRRDSLVSTAGNRRDSLASVLKAQRVRLAFLLLPPSVSVWLVRVGLLCAGKGIAKVELPLRGRSCTADELQAFSGLGTLLAGEVRGLSRRAR